MTNEEWAKHIGCAPGTPEFDRCVEALSRYGEHRWWLSDNPKERAYHQVLEEVQVLDWKQYGRDLLVLLGRMPHPWEPALPEFQQEVERAWKWGVGCTSEAEAEERAGANAARLVERYFKS